MVLLYFSAVAQTPSNDECSGAILINDARDFCSNTAAYSTANATASFTGSGQDVWFKFVARNFQVKITVSGASADGTLRLPEIRLHNDCGLTTRVAPAPIQDGNTTIFNDAGLIPGRTYYISIRGSNNTGTFKLCLQNYQSEIKPGQDYTSSSLLCNSENTIKEVNITGAGSNGFETAGTCLGDEKHSAWYKWTAQNSGDLVFTITPTKRDDIDWALFDLGPEGNTKPPSAATVIRCAAGHGIDNTGCPNEPTYTQTGLNFTESDTEEAGGCGAGQNGMLKAVTMVPGHVYALLVNNFTEGNNGFEIAFKDKAGKAGTGLFKGPTAKLSSTTANECTPQQSFTFTGIVTGQTAIQWYFGEGASIEEATTAGPFTITYKTPGLKTVVLQVKNDLGCSVVETQTFMVGIRPDPPVPTINKVDFCLTETIKFSTPEQANVTYKWTGPGNFTSDLREPEIVASSPAVAGTYMLVLSSGNCVTAPVSVVVPPIYKNPVAAFRTDPTAPAKLSFPASIRFFNESTDADSYLWDFGDGQTSTDINPEHTYTGRGNYDVKLTAYKTNVCDVSLVQGTFMISEVGAIFIPNTFTPNNDAVNDEFVINMNNIKTYHIQIYNRYGVPMYISENLVENWDGTYKNEAVPVGVYYYVVDAVDVDNNIIKKSGSVTILR